MQEVLTGIERRRRWSVEQKLRVLGEVWVNGASVADIARRHEITRQHIYQWRAEMRRKGLVADGQPRLLPVQVADDDGDAEVRDKPVGRVEIGFGNGRRLVVDAGIADAVLVRLIRITEAA